MSDIECPVCREFIISPYGMPCGHTICASCFSQLNNDNCPSCRCTFHSKNTFEPNLLLEQLLMEKNPDYMVLKKNKDRFIKLNKFNKLYTESEQFHDIKKILKNFIKINGYYVPIVTLLEEFCKAHNICETELYYIIDNISYFVPIEFDGAIYIVNCSSVSYLTKFVTDKQECFIKNPMTLFLLFIVDTTHDLINIVKVSGINANLYTKKKLSKIDSESYMTWILSHKDIPKYVYPDSDDSDDSHDYVDVD